MRRLFEGVQQNLERFADRPEETLDVLAGIGRAAREGEVLVSDHLLERDLAPKIQGIDNVHKAILYGHHKSIRCELEVAALRHRFDVIIELEPAGIQWGPAYEVTFDFCMVRWECQSTLTNSVAQVAQRLLFGLIPFGVLAKACADITVDRLVEEFGIRRQLRGGSLDAHGVTVVDKTATVDLEAQPQFAMLWQESPLSAAPLTFSGDNGSLRLADLFRATSIRADREGIHVAIEHSEAGRSLSARAGQ